MARGNKTASSRLPPTPEEEEEEEEEGEEEEEEEAGDEVDEDSVFLVPALRFLVFESAMVV